MYSLDGRTVGRSAPPLVFGTPVICQHCGEAYYHGVANPQRRRQRLGRRATPSSGGTSHVTSTGGGDDDDNDGTRGEDAAWWSKCVHRPLQIQLDNDFRASMLTDRDEALVQSAQLVTDVGCVRACERALWVNWICATKRECFICFGVDVVVVVVVFVVVVVVDHDAGLC